MSIDLSVHGLVDMPGRIELINALQDLRNRGVLSDIAHDASLELESELDGDYDFLYGETAIAKCIGSDHYEFRVADIPDGVTLIRVAISY